jgi:short-subunit dehydrogenase
MTQSNIDEQGMSFASLLLITGATGGLGKAFAVECASRGWNLFLTDLNAQALDTLAEGLRKSYGVTVVPRACDLTEAEARAELFRWIDGQRLRFWGLINVAGTDFEGPFFEQSSQQIRTIVRLNVEGTLDMTHAILARRHPAVPFRIINVASLAAFFPMPVKATYAASKRFLLDFSLALRNEVRDLGATVTVLCPAGLPTTPGCIQAIEAQGLMGYLTTQNIGAVADLALNDALQGKAVCIPGWLNHFVRLAGSLAPGTLVANLIGWRWKAARRKQFDHPLPPAVAQDGSVATDHLLHGIYLQPVATWQQPSAAWVRHRQAELNFPCATWLFPVCLDVDMEGVFPCRSIE